MEHASNTPSGALTFVRFHIMKLVVSNGTPQVQWTFKLFFQFSFLFPFIFFFNSKLLTALRPCCVATKMQNAVAADKPCLEHAAAF
jgi:hypothetical protein